MTKKAYRRGKKIKSIAGFLVALDMKGFVMVNNKVYHKEWAMSWTLRSITNNLKRGIVYQANRID